MASSSSSMNTFFDLCRHHRRRAIVVSLTNATETLTVSELARRVVRTERNEGFADLSSEVATDVVCSLVHVHLPKLADFGVVTYERDCDRITTTERCDQFEPHLTNVKREFAQS